MSDAVDPVESLPLRVYNLQRELAEARERMKANYKATLAIERMLYEAREQRDRLAEALEYVVDDLDVETRGRIGHSGKWCSLITAREVLAAVKGGGLPNNCQRPELCLLTDTCIPCEICPNAAKGGSHE